MKSNRGRYIEGQWLFSGISKWQIRLFILHSESKSLLLRMLSTSLVMLPSQVRQTTSTHGNELEEANQGGGKTTKDTMKVFARVVRSKAFFSAFFIFLFMFLK